MVTPWTSLFRRSPGLSRRSRRLAVAAAFLGYPLLIVGYDLLVAPGRISSVLWAPVAIGLFTLTLVGAVAVYGYGQGRMDRRARLDERQRQMADRALIVSYGVLATALTLALGALAVVASFQTVEIHMEQLSPWFIAAGLYLPMLPFAAIAWIEPDPPTDEA
jgi:amino acid transporter